jgi:hypothetical protein
LRIEAAGAHECLGGFSILSPSGQAKDERKALRNADCGKKKAEDRGYLQARLIRSETELKLSQYKIQ